MKKKERNTVLIFIGLIFSVYGLLVIFLIGTSALWNFIWIIGGAVFILAGFLWGKMLNFFPRWIKLCMLALVCIGILAFVFVEGKIIGCANSKPEDDAEYVIVLGAKVKSYGPSKEFALRIDGAIEYMEDHPNAVAVLTGGKGDDEPEEESLAAKKRMIEAGIKEDRILCDTVSTSTLENLECAMDIISQREITLDRQGNSKVVIVSSAFHLYRAGLLAKEVGFENVSFIGTNGLFILLPHYYVREFAAVVYSIF